MSLELILILGLLLLIATLGLRFSKLPQNIWLLFLVMPLATSAFPVIVLAGGLLSVKIAPFPELATLPLTLMIVGTATAVVPATLLMKRIGRKKGTLWGISAALLGSIFAVLSAVSGQFWLLVMASFLIGCCLAFIAQLRFAAIESLDNPVFAPKAISILMASGLFTAMLGPEIAVASADLIDSPYGFAGSFLVMGIFLFFAALVVSRLNPIKAPVDDTKGDVRKTSLIIKQPLFIIAFSSAVIGYSVMSFLMTASPLSMSEHHGYDLDSVKWVVQSHILAMYLPSLVYAPLEKYFGIGRLMAAGTLFYVLVIVAAMAGHSVMHFWWSMVLLGIGWNFLFTSGTLLLPRTYHSAERFKIQAINDFGMFTIQAIASLTAGIILFSQGWSALLSVTIPAVLFMFLITLWYYRITVSGNNIQQG